MYSPGIPLTVHSSGGRSASRASSQRTFVSSYSRRVSSGQSYHQGSRGVLVSASRAGAARAAAILLISCHVTSDDARMAGAQSPEDSVTGDTVGGRLCCLNWLPMPSVVYVLIYLDCQFVHDRNFYLSDFRIFSDSTRCVF